MPESTIQEAGSSEPIVITRSIAHSRDRVFEAWTSPQLFAQWFGTTEIPVPLETVSMDVREGGEWRATMVIPDGPRIDWTGEFVVIDRPNHLSLTLTDQPGEAPGAPLTVDFIASEGGTEMTMTQHSPDFGPEQREQTIEGWNSFFTDLERVLSA
ncbi:SRPBCC family protein [Humidisolicoccus flavus]|uniref:SRPBCC family protein n=1 Tax=Humidisolicoccus flavus TaxID=3111414 RepID=UPI003251F463